MKKIKYFMFVLSLILTVGFITAMATLKSIPKTFDWNLEEDEDENY
jgi:hypothetical protein